MKPKRLPLPYERVEIRVVTKWLPARFVNGAFYVFGDRLENDRDYSVDEREWRYPSK